MVFSRAGFFGAASPIAQPHFHAWSFYASNSDGTNLRQITDESFYMTSPASVSPDGKSMVVVAERLDTSSQICIYSLAGIGAPIQSLQPHVPNEADRKNPILAYPNFMPDGKTILFMAASNGKHHEYDYDVYRVSLETKSLERLRVSRDGKAAVFLKWRSDWHATPVESQIYLLDIETHKVTHLSVTGLN